MSTAVARERCGRAVAREAGALALCVMMLASRAAMALVTLNDPAGHVWDIDDQGTSTPPASCGSGAINNGSIDAYDTFGTLCITATGTAFSSVCVAADMYCGGVPPSTEMSGRQYVLGTDTLSGLEVVRRVYVPSTGPATADAFVRYLDTLTNPTAAPITVQIRIGTATTGSHNNDLGSDSSTSCDATWSGEALLDVSDLWFVTDDTDGTGDPTLGFVVQGTGATEALDFVALNPYGASDQSDLVWIFDGVTVPAGESISILTYMIQEGSLVLAQAECEYLVQVMLEAVEGLTGAQLTTIRNFAFCHDCDADGYAIDDGDCNDWNDLVNPGVTTDPCDGEDNDCDPATPDGAVETWFGDPCDSTDLDLCEDDSYACIGAAQGCLDNVLDLSDLCDGIDNDCDATTLDGSQDARLGAACDGDDPDLCAEGIGQCVSDAYVCTDGPETAPDLCDGEDNDCNPASPDGSSETWFGVACDSTDLDLCEDDARGCVGGVQTCVDSDQDLSDVCDGEDNDCDITTQDGSQDDRVGVACDGDDTDLCAEGTGLCEDGAFVCTDTMDETPELCDRVDNDCDPATPDGVDEDWYDAPCDGDDVDLCEESTYDCVAGVQVCPDLSGDVRDTCDGADNDCDPETLDGSDEHWFGDPCDGPDADLCSEGTYGCASGVQTCNDFTGDIFEACNGVDDDCNPLTPESVDNDGDGVSACEGDCDDGDPGIFPGAEEICDGIDQDCDPMTDHDGDGDGYRDCDGDCAPMNPGIHPGADENCTNGMDNDCDGIADFRETACGGTMDDGGSGCACAVVAGGQGREGAAMAFLTLCALVVVAGARRRRS